MRGIISLLALALTTGLVASAAHAGERHEDRRDDHGNHSFLYTCNISFRASGKSIYLGLGYTGLKGEGMISCYDYIHHSTRHIPIKMTARGPGVGLGVTGLVISGGATGLGLNRGPEALLGRYLTVRAGASAGVGVGAAAAIHLSHDSFTVDASIQAQGGLGAGVDILSVDLEADAEHPSYVDVVPEIAPIPAAAPVAVQPVAAPAPVPVVPGPAPVVEPAIPVATIPVKVLYVSENQPVHLVDAQGRLLQIIYLRPVHR